jgi:hypothetical protein
MKAKDVQYWAISKFTCSACNKLIFNNHIQVTGTYVYKFCFKCALEFCQEIQTTVIINYEIMLLSRNTIEKIRQQLNRYTPEEINIISKRSLYLK